MSDEDMIEGDGGEPDDHAKAFLGCCVLITILCIMATIICCTIKLCMMIFSYTKE